MARQPNTFEDRALAVARYIHVEVLDLPVEQFMDDQCDCDHMAHEVMQKAARDLGTYQTEIHANARAHGFWDGPDNENVPTKLMLIVSELGEALEEFRHDRMDLYYNIRYAEEVRAVWQRAGGEIGYSTYGGKNLSEEEAIAEKKPEGFGIELADALIRILDLAAYLGLDMAALVELKMEYNAGRPHMHGGRRV